ncbi:hypothetical protein HGRIS_008943 [Hohenbuehelia grisea]|uniref:Uncharacterized protein n=1 Tax=Hohenbuehelia grisea TaxID=104357 RepID=A0ABR3J006_9AGAR
MREAERHMVPGRKGATVFVWELDADGGELRSHVPRGNVENVWNMFSNSQRLYNAFRNEWDLCVDFDPGATAGCEDDDCSDDDVHSLFQQTEVHLTLDPCATAPPAQLQGRDEHPHSEHIAHAQFLPTVGQQAEPPRMLHPSATARPPETQHDDEERLVAQTMTLSAFMSRHMGYIAPVSLPPSLSANERHEMSVMPSILGYMKDCSDDAWLIHAYRYCRDMWSTKAFLPRESDLRADSTQALSQTVARCTWQQVGPTLHNDVY